MGWKRFTNKKEDGREDQEKRRKGKANKKEMASSENKNKNKSKAAGSEAKERYLLAYNAVEAAGWCAALVCGVAAWARHGTATTGAVLWDALRVPVAASQLLMVLDVAHAAAGLVRSSPVSAALQVASRVLVVAVLLLNPAAHTTAAGLALIHAAWCPTEVLRYAYYILKSVGASVPRAVTWLRYSTFFVLYPLGIAGELAILHASLAHYNAHAHLAWLRWFTFAVFVVYVPGSVFLYTHMMAQRAKVLANNTKKKTA